MLACVDVSYQGSSALAACLVFETWTDDKESFAVQSRINNIAPYEPGAFYRRELPCLVDVLGKVTVPLDVIVVDGYVWLSQDKKPGLGAHLYEALGQRVVIVGVAKTAFRGSPFAEPVLRGHSTKPLFLTAAGLDASLAAVWIKQMHGPHRIPTLLKRVDQKCRGT